MLPGPIRGSFENFSEHVVYSSQLYADLRSRVIRMESALIDFSRPPETEADERAYRAAQLVRPFTVGASLVRIGDVGDGGYVMAEPLTASHAISIGVGPNVSWDLDVAQRGIAVAMFDPTVDGPPSAVPGATFHAIGLGTPTQARSLGMELAELDRIIELADAHGRETLLKIDVEGAEWDALGSVGDFSAFGQIALEMHEFSRLARLPDAENVLAVLEAVHRTHLPVHVHGNNEEPAVRFGRFWLPDALEVSYLHRDLATHAAPAAMLDTTLDAPSNARYADIDVSGLLGVAPIA